MNHLERVVSELQGRNFGSFHAYEDNYIEAVPFTHQEQGFLRGFAQSFQERFSPRQVILTYYMQRANSHLWVEHFYGGPEAQVETFQTAYDALDLLAQRKNIVLAETMIEDERVESLLRSHDWTITTMHNGVFAEKYFKEKKEKN